MTKTIYSITPGDGRSDYSDGILGIISSHNNGKATTDFGVIMGYCRGDWARWSTIRNEPTFKYDKENGILEVYERELISFTVNEKIIEVLDTTVAADDEKQGDV